MQRVRARWASEQGGGVCDEAARLLARVTALPHGALCEAIRCLPDDERAQLDRLAGEIIDDARPFHTLA